MKKLFTKLNLAALLMALSFNLVAQDLFIGQPTSIAGWTSTQNGISVAPGGSTLPTVSSGTSTCLNGSTLRIGSNSAYLQITSSNPIARVKFDASGNATGTAIYTNIILTSSNGGTSWCTEAEGITFTTTGYDQPCSVIDINNLPVGTNAIQIWRKFGNTGSGQTIRMGNLNVWSSVVTPTITKTSGSNPASVIETLAMTPVVYTYSNVADAANVTCDWYTDNAYTATASAPAGLSIAKNTDNKTVTVSGTPTTAGTYYYKVGVNETGGNSIEGSVVVSAYVTPAPVITLTSSNANQNVKAGVAIADIVYTVQNASGATVTGLPVGLSGTYSNGTFTISGTVGADVTLGAFNYSITAIPLSGYTGNEITAAGSVSVKSATAKDILYLVAASTPDVKDTKLYPMLNNNNDYLVTVKAAASTAPAASAYDAYDLIVLNEIVGGTNAEAVALKNIDKPILNLKSFVYNAGRWVWGTGDNGKANNGIVTVSQPAHPVFANITLAEGTLELLSEAAVKGIQPADVTIGGIEVATAPKNASPYNPAVAIHDVPANVRGVGSSKYVMVALCNDSYDKMTSQTLTLLGNAVNYLISGTQFTPVTTSVAAPVASHITFDGHILRNAAGQEMMVYNATGRLVVRSVQDINMASQPAGVYFVKSNNKTIKIAVVK